MKPIIMNKLHVRIQLSMNILMIDMLDKIQSKLLDYYKYPNLTKLKIANITFVNQKQAQSIINESAFIDE